MQISRRILMACVTAVSLLPLALPAADNEAQARARQALEGTTHNPPAAQPTAPETPATPVAPAAPAAPAMDSAPTAAAQPPAAPAADNEAVARALDEALRQKMNQIDKQPPPATVTPMPAEPAIAAPAVPKQPTRPAPGPQLTPAPVALPAPAPAPARAPAPTVQKPSRGAYFEDLIAVERNAEADRRTNEALSAIVAELDAREAPPAQNVQRPKPVRHAAESILPAIPAPPPAVSAAKQQRLDALLARYMADAVSPEQYHAERAKILAEP